MVAGAGACLEHCPLLVALGTANEPVPAPGTEPTSGDLGRRRLQRHRQDPGHRRAATTLGHPTGTGSTDRAALECHRWLTHSAAIQGRRYRPLDAAHPATVRAGRAVGGTWSPPLLRWTDRPEVPLLFWALHELTDAARASDVDAVEDLLFEAGVMLERIWTDPPAGATDVTSCRSAPVCGQKSNGGEESRPDTGRASCPTAPQPCHSPRRSTTGSTCHGRTRLPGTR